MMKTLQLALLLCIAVASSQSCTVPKEARIRKQLDAKQNKKEIILHAYGDGVFGSTTIELYDDQSFVEDSFGFCLRFYKWGNWTENGDSFTLTYDTPEEKSSIWTLKVEKEKGIVLMSSDNGNSITLRLMYFHEK